MKMSENGKPKQTVSLRLGLSCPHSLKGSLAWLRERARLVRLCDRISPRGATREAILLDREGRPLVRLASLTCSCEVVPGKGRCYRVQRFCLSGSPDSHGPIIWSPAAWALLCRIAEKALAVMSEPSGLAGTVEVQLGPVDERAKALLLAWRDEPKDGRATRDALRDLPEPPRFTPPPPPCNGKVPDDDIPF
jgi:hypothetical protein